jgi:hypothetical protein
METAMTFNNRIAAFALAAFVAMVALSVSDAPVRPGRSSVGFSTAEAIIGRPLTPMSYAGVARRTARRW